MNELCEDKIETVEEGPFEFSCSFGYCGFGRMIESASEIDCGFCYLG